MEDESAVMVSDDSFLEACSLPSLTIAILHHCYPLCYQGYPHLCQLFSPYDAIRMPGLRVNLVNRFQCVALTTFPERSLLCTQCL